MSVYVGGQEKGTLDGAFFESRPQGGVVKGAGVGELVSILGAGFMEIEFDLYEDGLPYAVRCRVVKVQTHVVQNQHGSGGWGQRYLEYMVLTDRR